MQQRQPNPHQLDLFCPGTPPALPGEVRRRVLPLLGALIREVARQAKEADHEDHA